MTEMIRAENLSLAGISAAISFAICGGDMIILLTPKDEVSASLTNLLIGLEKPSSGKIFLFGFDTAARSDQELRDARRRIGIAYGSGGLVSNLKAWENLTLPLYYHQHLSHEEIKTRGLSLLGRLGYTGKLMDLPGNLSLSQKKIIGVARAMLIAPDMILYESPVSGMDQEEKNNFFKIAEEFHRENPDRSSVFITSDRDVVRYLPEAVVVNLTKGRIL